MEAMCHLRFGSVCLRQILLHFSVEEVDGLTEQMVAGVSAVDAVVAVGVDVHLEVLVGLHQSLGIFSRVAEMHVVVGQSVTDEQLAA